MRRWILMMLLLLALCGCAGPRPLSSPRRTPTIPVTTDNPNTTTIDSSASNPTLAADATPNNAFVRRPTADPFIALSPTPVPTVEQITPTFMPTPVPTVANTATPAVVIIPVTPSAIGNEQRWRTQQEQRTVFDPVKLYEARTPVTIFWYDPVTGQVLEIGTLRGIFPAQAQFTFRPNTTASLEIPYRINGDFGLTSISDAVLERMSNAGYTTTVEVFVYLNESIVPQQ